MSCKSQFTIHFTADEADEWNHASFGMNLHITLHSIAGRWPSSMDTFCRTSDGHSENLCPSKSYVLVTLTQCVTGTIQKIFFSCTCMRPLWNSILACPLLVMMLDAWLMINHACWNFWKSLAVHSGGNKNKKSEKLWDPVCARDRSMGVRRIL